MNSFRANAHTLTVLVEHSSEADPCDALAVSIHGSLLFRSIHGSGGFLTFLRSSSPVIWWTRAPCGSFFLAFENGRSEKPKSLYEYS